MRKKLFDIVIATYNNLDELTRCLQSFENQTLKEFNVFVCVDGSTDETVSFLENGRFKFDFQILQHDDKKNKGRSAVRNLAIPHLNSEYMLIFDSDNTASFDLTEKHHELLREQDCVSIGEIVYKNPEKNLWTSYYQTRGKGKFRHNDTIPFWYLITGNVAIKTKYFIEVNGLDQNIKIYGGEDTEFAYRLHKKFNLPTVFNKNAVSHSTMSKSLAFALKQRQVFGATNLHYIANKHPQFKELFWFHLMTNKGIKPLLFRMMLSRPNEKIALFLLPFVPGYFKNKLISFLVLYRIYLGYMSKLNGGGKNDQE